MDVENRVLTTPSWVFGIRIAQVILSIVVLGLCAAWTGWGIDDAPALGIAAAVFTWFIVTYQVLTEKLAPLRVAYHIVAVVVLDLYMIIIWLCTWALNAARSAQFADAEKAANNVDDNFGADDDEVCFMGSCIDIKKRSIEPRMVKFKSLKGLLGGAAGVGAVVWILFISTFAWTILSFLKGRKEGRFPLNPMSRNTGHVEEAKAPATQQPMQPQRTGQEQYQPAPAQTEYAQDPNQASPIQQPQQQTQQ